MLDPLEMESFIKSIAARADLKVEWEDTPQPRTDGRTIWLPRITASMTEDEYASLRHYVVHEVDHVRFTNFKQCKDEPTCKEGILGAIINMVEDIRVESIGSKEFLGDRINSGNVQAKRIAEIAELLKGKIKRGDRDNEMVKTGLPLIEWSHKHWTDMYPAVAGSASAFEKLCLSDPDAAKYMERFRKGSYDAAVRALTDTAGSVQLAEKICREVYEVDPDEERKRAKEERKKNKGKDKSEEEDDAEDGEGEGEGGGEGEGEGKDGGEGEGKEDKGKGEKGKLGKGGKGKPRDHEVTVDYTSIMPDPHESNGPTRHAMHINYKDEHFTRGSYNPATSKDYRVWPRGEASRTAPSKFVKNGDQYLTDMRAVLRRTNPNFAHKVRTILQVRAKDRIQYGTKRGMLHQGSLYRMTVKDAPHYAERVFKKKIVSDVLDSCVFLLVDQSGSMGGEKFTHAAVAAAMMNEVVGNVLHIPTFVASFTDFGYGWGGTERQNIFIHRDWKDQLLSNENLLKSFSDGAKQGMGNNADGDAIMWAFNKIASQREKRKLIIVFSDGQPAGGGRGDVPWYTKKVVEDIEQQTPINIVGIGIQDSTVKHIYKEHYVIRKVDQLEEALLSVIEGKLK